MAGGFHLPSAPRIRQDAAFTDVKARILLAVSGAASSLCGAVFSAACAPP